MLVKTEQIEKLKPYIANIITACRILCSILMLFFPIFSIQFYILYLLCGISDMTDGVIARKTNSVSESGARFDTVADFIFLVAAMVKILPLLHIPEWLLQWIVIIACIKISTVIRGFIHRKKLIALHTVMNKITGGLLFLLPLTLQFIELKFCSAAVCAIATFSAIQEGCIIGKELKKKHSCR